MRKYICKKDFIVDSYDGDGFLIPGKEVCVSKGDIYELDENGSTYIGGDIHLDSENGAWLELSKESFEELFELYNKDGG